MKLNPLRLAARIAFVMAISLVLRADEGCLTEDRTVEGSVPLTLTADWTSTGYLDNTDSDNGNAGQFAQRIIAALNDTENVENIVPEEVTVAGARARVTANRGHSSARTATVQITTNNKATNTLLEMRVPDNEAGTEVTASDNDTGSDLYMVVGGDGVAALQADFRDFLTAYLAHDLVTAENILDNISWSAMWETDNPPTQQSPDDFDWVTEIILHIPSEWDLTVISI